MKRKNKDDNLHDSVYFNNNNICKEMAEKWKRCVARQNQS